MSRLKLIRGNSDVSSWSMRAWLLLRWLECEFEDVVITLDRDDSLANIMPWSPSGRVPVLIDGDIKIWDSFAIMLHLADSHPKLWPSEPAKRAYARSISAEMHSGFTTLRLAMPFDLANQGKPVLLTPPLRADIARLEAIWIEGLKRFGGPWLAGEFGIADITFAPVAVRFHIYGMRVREPAETYRLALLRHPLVEQWLAEANTNVDIENGKKIKK